MQNTSCRFCRANGLLRDAPVAVTRHHYVLASLDPEMPMAVMVVPIAHHDDPFSLSPDEWADFADALSAAKAHLKQYKPDGYTLGWNVGHLGGQTVGHAHCHVITRHADELAAGHGIRSLLKAGRAYPETLAEF